MAYQESYTPQELESAIRSGEVDPNLPPAGYQRREVLAERQDSLAQAAEEASQDMGTINPALFEEDRDIQREIRRGFLDLDIGELYIVKWVNFVNQHGNAVWAAKYEGWRVVTADMVRDLDRDLVREDNTLRVGDVIAMFIRKDQHLLLERKRAEKQAIIQHGAEVELIDLANKHPNALKVHSDLTGGNPYGDRMAKRAAQQTAMRHLGNKMKQGTIPGVPIK